MQWSRRYRLVILVGLASLVAALSYRTLSVVNVSFKQDVNLDSRIALEFSVNSAGLSSISPRDATIIKSRKVKKEILIDGLLETRESFESSKPVYKREINSPGSQVFSVAADRNTNDNVPLVPCLKVGKARQFNQNTNWREFVNSLEEYTHFHKQQIDRIKSGDLGVRTLSYVCYDPTLCAGIGDQLYTIQQILLLAIASRRALLLDWDKTSLKTFQHLLPNRIEWNTKYLSTEIHKVSITHKFRGKNDYIQFMSDIEGSNKTHIRISRILPVPFLKGMTQLLRMDKHKILSKLSLDQLLTSKKHIPISIISGEMLRYLFTFSKQIYQKVDKAQKLMGIANSPYIGVHIRTGFFGTEYEEGGHFSRMKIFRKEATWHDTIECSLALSDKFSSAHNKMPLYLATDSYLVKELVTKDHGERVRSLNMTLQHVAIPSRYKQTIKEHSAYENTNLTISKEGGMVRTLVGVDGFMATWIDFLLLARADILVHSTSGFSTLAGQFCPVERQLYTPTCSKTPSAKYNQ